MGKDRRGTRLAALLVVFLVAAGACGSDDGAAPAASTTTTAGAQGGQSGTTASTAAGRKATGEPIRIGMISQEGTPVGSYTEGREAFETGLRYVNEELGGVNGRPIEVESCITKASPETSQKCGTELAGKKPVLVTKTIDLFTAQAYPSLNQAGIPMVGGQPTDPADYTNKQAYFLSGGTLVIIPAIGKFAGEFLKAKNVAILSSTNAAAASALPLMQGPLTKQGIKNTVHKAGDAEADYTSLVQAASGDDPDAYIALFPAQACAGIMNAMQSLGIDKPVVATGLCNDKSVIDKVGGAAEGWVFGTSGPNFTDPNSADPDVRLYLEKAKQYGKGKGEVNTGGTAPFGFTNAINIHRILSGIQGEVTSQSVQDYMKAQKDAKQFAGPNWTCGQLPTFPAVCGTGARFIRYEGSKRYTDATDGKYVTGVDLLAP